MYLEERIEELERRVKVLEALVAQLRGMPPIQKDLPTLANLEGCISVRVYNCFLYYFWELSGRSQPRDETAKLITLIQMAGLNDTQLLKIRNFGRKCLREWKEVLAELGLKPGMSQSEILACITAR